MRILWFCLLLVAGAALQGCSKKAPVPAPVTANMSVAGSWISPYSLSPGAVVTPGQAGMGQFLNSQISFSRDGTFTKNGGIPVSGTWKQSGLVVTLNVDKILTGDKNGALNKLSYSMDMVLSSDGKTLSDSGGGGIKYHRG